MAKFSLRKPENQASASVVLSLSSLFFLMGMAVLMFRRFESENLTFYYSAKTLRFPMILVSALLAGALATIGFGFGLNSAGNRRNFRTKHSWLGFFIGAFGICATIIMFALFWFWKESVL